MTQEETIKVLQSIEDRATDFPYMTACDWVAISAAKRHLNSINVKEVDLENEIRRYRMNNPIIGHREESLYDYMTNVAKHFFELGLKVAQKVE